MFNLFETEIIYSPTILIYPNNLIGQIKVIAISIFQMILVCYNNKWRYRPIIRIDALDYNNLFSIARLYSFSFFTPVVRHYNKNKCDLAYKKVCFVEIPDVRFYNTIFGNYILEKSKPSSNDL